MKEEILEKDKMKNLRTKIYLMMIILNLNLIKNNENEAYNQEEDFSEIFYYNLNKIENPSYEDNRIEDNEDYENNGEFENLYNE